MTTQELYSTSTTDQRQLEKEHANTREDAEMQKGQKTCPVSIRCPMAVQRCQDTDPTNADRYALPQTQQYHTSLFVLLIVRLLKKD